MILVKIVNGNANNAQITFLVPNVKEIEEYTKVHFQFLIALVEIENLMIQFQ